MIALRPLLLAAMSTFFGGSDVFAAVFAAADRRLQRVRDAGEPCICQIDQRLLPFVRAVRIAPIVAAGS